MVDSFTIIRVFDRVMLRVQQARFLNTLVGVLHGDFAYLRSTLYKLGNPCFNQSSMSPLICNVCQKYP